MLVSGWVLHSKQLLKCTCNNTKMVADFLSHHLILVEMNKKMKFEAYEGLRTGVYFRSK